jgi:acetyl/propionyl-CoA carboxylase alpha subunit
VRRLQRALDETVLLGLTTNLPFLSDLVSHPAFVAGELDTGFLAEHFGNWRPSEREVTTALIAVTLAQWRSHPQHPTNHGYWRNNPNGPALYRYQLALVDGGREEDSSIMEVWLQPLPRAADQYLVSLSSEPEKMVPVCVNEWADSGILLTIDGHRQWITLSSQGSRWWIKTEEGMTVAVALSRFPESRAAAAAGSSLRAPMPGLVLAVLVEVGQTVEAGQPLMKLEAMKMEHTVHAVAAGIVEAIHYAPGDQVEDGALLISMIQK